MKDSNVVGAGREAHRPLTVLQVLPSLGTGGVERGTVEIADAIVSAGGRALVASASGAMAHRALRAGAELFEMNLTSKNLWQMAANTWGLARIVKREGVDVIHARSRAPAWSAYWAALHTGVPFVTTYHGTYNEDLPFKRFYNSVMARGRPVIATSEFIADLVRKRHRIPPEQIVTIPRGADISVFSEETVGNERAVKLAQSWGLLDDPRPVVMLPGRLTRWKGAESMIDAAALLRDRRGEDFLIVLVGDDGGSGFGQTLMRRIRDTGTENVVRMPGATDDMPAAYKLSSVVVSASIEPEAFGRVVVEAQAMGRPVIASNHGGARETVADRVSGWLYPPGNAEALAEAVDAALQLDPSARAHMGLAARARIHASFTTSAMQRRTLNVYETVTGRSFAQEMIVL